MQVTPENVATLMQGATPTQIVILIMMGLLIAGAIYIIVEKMINSRLKPFEKIPEQLEEIKDGLSKNREAMVALQNSLWTESRMKNLINNQINEFAKTCDGCTAKCANFKSR